MPKLSVSIDSVFCRLEIKEVHEVAEKHSDQSTAIIQGLKMQLDMQNGINYREKKTMISLRDWGLMVVRAGLFAIACSEEDEQEESDDSAD